MMRKRMAALLLVAFSLAIFADCSTTAKQNFDDYQKVATWNGSESTAHMDLSVSCDGQTFKIPAQMVGESTSKDGAPQLAHAKVSFGDVSMPKHGNIKLPDLDAYMDMRDPNHIQYYLNKAYFYNIVGSLDIPSLKAYVESVPGDYVVIDSDISKDAPSNADELTNGRSFVKELFNLLYKDVGVPVDMKKDGETSHLTLNEKDMVGLVKASVDGYAQNKAPVDNHLTKIYGPELMKQIIPSLEKAVQSLRQKESDKDLKELEQSMKGSHLDIKETFDKDVYQSEMTMGLNLNVNDQPIHVDLKMTNQSKKNDKTHIELPKNAVKVDLVQLIKATNGILISVDGKPVFSDQDPVIQNDRVLVPYRAIAEATGAKVEWHNDTRTVTVDKNGKKVELKIDDKTAKVDGKDVDLDVPASIMNSRTMVPLRFVGESLGYKVDWHGDAQFISLTKLA